MLALSFNYFYRFILPHKEELYIIIFILLFNNLYVNIVGLN